MAFLCVQLQALNVPRVWTAVRWRSCVYNYKHCTYHGFGQQCDGVPVCTTTSTERTTGLDSSAMAFLCVQLQALNVPRVWTAVRWRSCVYNYKHCTYHGFGQQCDGVPVCTTTSTECTTGLDSSAMAFLCVQLQALYVPQVWTAVRWRSCVYNYKH